MADQSIPEIYLLHVWIRQISPMIGRRLLVRSDSTLAALHHTIQIAFGWTDSHLHRFRIHGRDSGIGRMGGPAFSNDARQVRLDSFQLRLNERFLYEYDLRDSWRHEVRVERRLAIEPKRTYLVCVGGRRAAPPEDCGNKRPAFVRAYDHPGCHRTSHLVDRLLRRLDHHLYCTQHLHGTTGAAEQGLRGWSLIHNFAPSCPETARKSPGLRSPAERLNGMRYHAEWLPNLLVSASLGGYRCPPRKA
jgi:Plasmid pRiA4b ORF-3-like protein